MFPLSPMEIITALLGAVIGAVASGIVTRSHNHRERLQGAWAEWIASALEAVERCSELEEAEGDIASHASAHETLAPPIDGIRARAEEAESREKRDYQRLALLERDEKLLEVATTISNEVTFFSDEKRGNVAKLRILELARYVRARTLGKSLPARPEPLRLPDNVLRVLEGAPETGMVPAAAGK